MRSLTRVVAMAALCGCPLRNARAKLWPGRGPGSFRTRGGRERRHEAALFFLVSGVGLVLSSAPLWISRNVLDLETPDVSVATQEIADFISPQIVGTLIAMIFRFWALRKWVFPDEKPSVRQRAIGSRSRLHERGGLMTANPEAGSADGLLHAAGTPHEPAPVSAETSPRPPFLFTLALVIDLRSPGLAAHDTLVNGTPTCRRQAVPRRPTGFDVSPGVCFLTSETALGTVA